MHGLRGVSSTSRGTPSKCAASRMTSTRSPRRSARPACPTNSRIASSAGCEPRRTRLCIVVSSRYVYRLGFSTSVQESLSTSQPQAVVRWMGMRRALIALVIAAAVAIAGVAAYVYMYEGSIDVAVKDDSGAWAHVWLTFTQVWVHEAGKSEDVGWHNLTVAQSSIDLASLVNVSELLASA